MARKNHNGPVISVRAFLEDAHGRVLLLKRPNNEYEPGKWSLPGGVVNYTESPEKGLDRIIKQKTGLDLANLDFLAYQDSPPASEGLLHCLNMYFQATTAGTQNIDPAFSEYKWVAPSDLNQYALAFRGNEAIKFYEDSKQPGIEQIIALVNEAGKIGIPVTTERIEALQALPGFFQQLSQDLLIYDMVKRKVHTTLEMIQSQIKRGADPIIAQVQSRIKTPESLMEKMVRKGKNNIPRHYTTLDDTAGARAVVSFLKDVYTVRDALLSFSDFKCREEEDYIKFPQDTGYRALHLTLEVPIPGAAFIPRCEVQIKTLYQHSWSNATHELTYKRKHIPAEYLGTFLELAKLLHEADRTAEDLRHDIEHLSDSHPDTVAPIPTL